MARKTTDPIDILLEMGIDLDNLSEEEDYLSALIEAVNILTIKDSNDSRIVSLQKEILKVRKKRFAEARPEVKKTKINPDAFFDKKKPEEQAQSDSGQNTLPTSAIVKTSPFSPDDYKTSEELEPQEETKKKPREKVSDPLKDILKGINAIIKTLNQQQKFSKKQAEKDRKSAEKEKREQSEKDLEKSGLKKFISGVGKILKPVKSLLNGVFEFISKVLIGNLLVKIIEWMGNPDNKKKLDAIGEFFKATWPALLAAFVAFKLSLGGFITNLIGLVGKFLPKLLGLIPKMLSGLKTLATGNPLATAAVAGAALFAAGKIIPEIAPGTVEADTDKEVDENVKTKGGEQTASDLEAEQATKKGERNAFENFLFGTIMGEDAEYEKQKQRAKTGEEPKQFNQGGMVPGSGPNKDTVPAMLAPGEFVMSRGAVQKYGADTMASMNAAGGGDNLPKRMNGITYAVGGGLSSGPNKDTVPAMLAPGEFVMSRGAVQKYGADTMASMNAAGGGTNLPKRMNGVTYAVGGGLMGDMSDYGYGDDKKEEQSPIVAKEMEERKEKASNPIGDFFGGMASGVRSLFGGDGGDKETPKGGADGEEKEESGSTLSETQQKALQVLAKYESGAAGYDAVNQYGTKGGRGVEGFSGDIKKMPQHKGRSLTDFTIGEIKALQYDDKSMSKQEWISAGKLHAVGAYQFIGNTLPGVASRAGIPDTAKFTPAVQDLMALQLMKERGISPWVGPSDKATASERAIIEQARLEPIAYDKTSGGGAVTAFGGGGSSYTSPGGGGLIASSSGGGRSVSSSAISMSGKSGIDMFLESDLFKKSSSKGSSIEPMPSRTSKTQTTMSEGQNPSANSSAAMIANQNIFPDLDANAMWSQDKIKTLGITVA